MTRLSFLSIAVLAAACGPSEAARQAAADSAAAAQALQPITVADSFRTPESVVYDATMDVYVVGNINGTPFDKDDNGFLSRVGTDGRVVELRWVDGATDSVTLNAPKGLAIRNDTLFVADIDELRMFDRITGRALGSVRVPGATFLNDVAAGADAIYVTDTGMKPDWSGSGTDAVWRIVPGQRPQPLARGAALAGPNGVLAEDSTVLVNTWSGAVFRLDARGARTELPRPAGGQLDGLVKLSDGSLVVTAWADSSVQRLAPGDSAWTRITQIESPADLGLDTRRNRLLIPVFSGNRVEIRPL